MSKADNMLSILWLLKSGKKMTAKQLAEALEMNIRTVYRYIDALCASGVPIISDAGHNGGYSLLQQFNEAPLFFDLSEQKALVHAAVFAQEAGYPFGSDLTRAISKLKRYTNEEQRQTIDRHSMGFDVIQSPADPALESVLQQLELAVANGQTLTMEYKNRYEHHVKSRQIDPYGLVFWRTNWYVIAFCHLRGEIRSFRANRIESVTRTESTFQRPAHFSARHFFLTTLLPEADNGRLISVHVKGRQQAIQDLCGHWFLGHALVERSVDQAHFQLDEELVHTQVPHLLLPFGKSLSVVEPVFLKERLAAIAKDLLDYYQSS